MTDDTSVRITAKTDGPFLVQGPVTIVRPDGTVLDPPVTRTGVVKLCSCGLSATKPFCDASHKQLHQPTEPAP